MRDAGIAIIVLVIFMLLMYCKTYRGSNKITAYRDYFKSEGIYVDESEHKEYVLMLTQRIEFKIDISAFEVITALEVVTAKKYINRIPIMDSHYVKPSELEHVKVKHFLKVEEVEDMLIKVLNKNV